MAKAHYDFFIAQAQHKANSLLFYRLFALVVFLHCLVVALLVVLAGFLLTNDLAISQFVLALFLLFVYMAFGIFLQKYRLAQGGVALAKKMGAVRLFISQLKSTQGVEFFPTFIKATQINELPSGYARFYEFAVQMSLASGVPLPLLYVLPNEQGINGFVAGFDERDRVLVLTQGAIDCLDNEGLYALIAHQYSAIMHGDDRLNLKVAVATTGLSWFYESAEWLERLLLGEFNADYHKSLENNQSLSHQDWLSYWQQKHQQQAPYSTFSIHRPKTDAQDAFVFALPLFGLLILVRLLGFWGMVSSDWLVVKFNHQRSLLADATSIQLTRSYGIAQVLKKLYNHSSYLNNRTMTHLGYFFFAPIRPQDEFFETHPSLAERLDRLGDKAYFAQGSQIVAPLNKQTLKEQHDVAVAHAPIVALAQEILIETMAYQEAPQDKVIDGRLVVNQEWFDWHDEKKDDIKPKQSHIATKQYNEDLPDVFTLNDIKKLSPDWIISKYQRAVLGTIIVLESVQLMRFDFLPSLYQFNLYDIYIRHLFDDDFDNQDCIKNDIDVKTIYPHLLDDELLNAIAKIDRKADGVLTYLAIKRLNEHLHNVNIPLTDKNLAILNHYYDNLCQVLMVDNVNDEPIKNYKKLIAKIYKLYQGAVLALLLKTLGKRLKRTIEDTHHQLILDKFNHIKTLMNFDKKMQISIILLAFLVLVQDNTLLLGQTNKLTQTLARLIKLANLPCVLPDDEAIALMHTVLKVSTGEWAVLLLVLTCMDNAKNFVETLHTACLYDTHLAQKESDLLLILKELL